MAVDPRGSDLQRLLTEDPGGPVVMLNLLRFAPGGRATYEEYLRLAEPLLIRHGGTVIYAGDGSTAVVGEGGQEWDAVLLVRYPDRSALSRMVADPEYQQIAGLRSQSLSEAVLQATTPW